MQEVLKYTSTAQSFFDSWRIGIGLFTLVVISAVLSDPEVFYRMTFFGLMGCVGIILLIMFLRISVIKRHRNILSCRSILKQMEIKNISGVETWWSYEFKPADPVKGGYGPGGKARQLINYIYIFAKISGSNGSVVIYELIQLSSKFPNNHPYNAHLDFDKTRSFKVYDIDDCLKKMNLDDPPRLGPKA